MPGMKFCGGNLVYSGKCVVQEHPKGWTIVVVCSGIVYKPVVLTTAISIFVKVSKTRIKTGGTGGSGGSGSSGGSSGGSVEWTPPVL